MNVREAITEFMIAREADGLAQTTLAWYRSGLAHLAERYGDEQLETITTTMMRVHIIGLRNRFSDETAGDYVRQLHTFWTWCSREYGLSSPMRNIRYEQPRRSAVPRAADTADIRQLLTVEADTYEGKRNRAIVWFLLDTGCRNAGLRALKLDDLHLEEGYAFVTEKGNKTRRVFMSPPNVEAMRAWLDVRAQCSEYVFFNIRNCQPLTSDGLRQILRRMAEAVGVKGRVNPHAFRHAFAREFLRSGGDIARLQMLLGHADYASTMQYLIFTDDETRQAHKRHSPSNLY